MTRAETTISSLLVQHNLPLAQADDLEHLFRKAFPDSKIANDYSSAGTKTTVILNETSGPHCHSFAGILQKSPP